MKKLLLLPLIAISFVATAQTTLIPDPVFEQALINAGLDNVIDGGVLTANINGVTSLSAGVAGQSISDLTGIEDFTALDSLFCSNNQLTSLDLSQNTALTTLVCGANQLMTLDLSQNTALKALDCDGNILFCLNVKNGNNSNFTYFMAVNNPNLSCIEVDDVAWSDANWGGIDPASSFSTNCNNSCSGLAQDTCDYVDTTYVTVYDTTFVTIYDTVFVSVTDTLIMDITLTGIPLPNNTNTMLVYPNPASDVVIIDNGDYLSMSGYTLKIINSLGQEVFNSTINIPVFSIPVSTLGSVGTYYIQVFDTSPNIVQTKALILQ